jgi:hypothetical protein
MIVRMGEKGDKRSTKSSRERDSFRLTESFPLDWGAKWL